MARSRWCWNRKFNITINFPRWFILHLIVVLKQSSQKCFLRIMMQTSSRKRSITSKWKITWYLLRLSIIIYKVFIGGNIASLRFNIILQISEINNLVLKLLKCWLWLWIPQFTILLNICMYYLVFEIESYISSYYNILCNQSLLYFVIIFGC